MAETEVGCPGTVAGVTELLALLAVEVPMALAATIVNVYDCPLVSVVTVIGDAAP